MEGKISKTEIVLVKLDCSDGKTRSFSCPVNVNMDRVDGMFINQISSNTNTEADPTAGYAVYSSLTGSNLCLVDKSTTTPNTFIKLNGQTVSGNYTFRVDDLGSATTMHLVIGILMTFVKFN